MNPADLLRRAADHIEQMAADTSTGPWKALESYPAAWVVRANTAEWYDVATESSTGDITGPDAKWIATLGPQIAGPLVGVLRDAALQCDIIIEREGWEAFLPEVVHHLEHLYGEQLDLARAILGEQP